MKSLLILIALFYAVSSSFSQNDQIQKIREHYNTINEDNNLHHDLEMNYVFAAIGDQTKKVRFYFVSEQKDPEKDPYEMNYDLLKAEIKYNISASVFYSIEYLYDYSGKLMFFFEKKEGYENSEKRYYFLNGKLIKCIIKSGTEEGNQINYTDSENFKEEDVIFSNTILKKAEQYKYFFNHVNSGAEIY